MVALKTDGILENWKWKEVLWVYWIFFTVMIGITLGFCIIFFGKIYEKCIENIDWYKGSSNKYLKSIY